ncbi:PREDICTED: FBD-associated F-box protein At5g56370-like isoform X2 [Tarenaya hassleriana]|uniref:FBD-associated F-box protein At5g56370-like isoform X2 n=1 Tax=Tarenaya hassleriana TaxID=28532 RepID=UPI00053C9B55|nr:PREDICTED: FBD-associated F-box protein At5g56370-like isoform X2 [Tarenaya hassleriana]
MDDKGSINRLQDDEIILIMSLLNTNDAVAMSFALLKRWPLWERVSKLVFDDRESLLKLLVDGHLRSHNSENPDHERFSRFVDGALRLNKAPVLESFDLSVGPSSGAEDIQRWVLAAIHRSVHEMRIYRHDFESTIDLPGHIFTCKTLVVLKLVNGICLDVPCTIHLPSLKTLHLSYILFTDEESFSNLVSCSPVLEDLDVDTPDIFLTTITIRVPSLKKLRIVTFNRIECWVLYVPEVVEAHVGVLRIYLENFLAALSSVKRLSWELISDPDLVVLYPTGRFLNQLVHLKLQLDMAYSSEILMSFLEHSPGLQSLEIVQVTRPRRNYSRNRVRFLNPCCSVSKPSCGRNTEG